LIEQAFYWPDGTVGVRLLSGKLYLISSRRVPNNLFLRKYALIRHRSTIMLEQCIIFIFNFFQIFII